MSDSEVIKKYDLEERTFIYAKNVRLFVKQLPKTMSNMEDAKQLIRSSGSVGANYIEANWSLGKKDFTHKIRICRKEARESRYWLELIDCGDNKSLRKEADLLGQESIELMKIFASILQKFNEK